MSRESIVAGATAGGTRRAATHYGRRVDEGKHVSEFQVSQDVWKQVTTFRFDQLPMATLDELHQRIPAGARVLACSLAVSEDFTATSATTLQVGLSEPDGTVIDADGLVAATALGTLVTGAYVDGAGALIGASSQLGVEGQVVVTPDVDDLLTGELTITIEYQKRGDRQQEMNG